MVAGKSGRTRERADYPYLWHFHSRRAHPSGGRADANDVLVVCNQVLPKLKYVLCTCRT